MTSGNSVLITGVAGFIGSNLADDLLKNGYRVIGIDNLSYGVREQVPSGVEFHKLDIRSKEIYPLFEGVDFVFHLAAKNCISDCQADPVETSDINVTGMANVLEASRRAKVRRVIYAESSAMYEGSKALPTPEADVQARSFYAISKVCNNAFAYGYYNFFGLKTVGLRYFNVYGPRQDYRRTIPPVASAFIIKLLKNEPPTIYGDGSKRRDFVHVDDINSFHLMCLNDDRVDGRVFNLGSGVNHSILEIYKMISEIMGKNISPIFKPDLEGEAKANLADIKAAKELGWSPKVDLQEGLKGMASYIKTEFAKGNIK